MQQNEKIETIVRAFAAFKKKMSDIRKRQLVLFDRVDRTVSAEKAEEIRRKINND